MTELDDGVEYLELQDLLRLTEILGAGPVRDLGLLKSAAYRPRTVAFGTELYPTVGLKAAALLHSIVRNHALVDGNKRLALLAAAVFADLNGSRVEGDDDAIFDTVMAAAVDEIGLPEIARRLGLE